MLDFCIQELGYLCFSVKAIVLVLIFLEFWRMPELLCLQRHSLAAVYYPRSSFLFSHSVHTNSWVQMKTFFQSHLTQYAISSLLCPTPMSLLLLIYCPVSKTSLSQTNHYFFSLFSSFLCTFLDSFSITKGKGP